MAWAFCLASRLSTRVLAALAMTEATSAMAVVAMKRQATMLGKHKGFIGRDCAGLKTKDKQIAFNSLSG